MKRISDEIREWSAYNSGDYVDRADCDELRAIADRIDAEMVELPRDRDGVPIRLDDTVYLNDIRSAKVIRIDIEPTNTSIFCSTGDVKSGWYQPSDLTHENPDSLERIADDIEESKGTVSIESSTLDKWADRIRKLAKEDK